MIDHLVFLNNNWIWPGLLIAGLLFGLFIWKEWRLGKSRFWLKLVCAFIAISALLLLALKPAIPQKVQEGVLAILTENYKTKDLDSLIKAYPNLKILDRRESDNLNAVSNAKQVFVLGEGLKSYELWQLENTASNFLPVAPGLGLLEIHYKPEFKPGDSIKIKALYKNANLGDRIFLKDPGKQVLDSIILQKEEIDFEWQAEAKLPGNFLYTLSIEDSLGDPIKTEYLPIKIIEAQNLKILMLNSFPNFETRNLKNFLAETGHEVLVKSRITAGRYKYEAFNTNDDNFQRLSGAFLENFDLLISDAGMLNSLAASEVSALEQSIKNDGLGLFIQGGVSELNRAGRFSVFDFEAVAGNEISPVELPAINLETQNYRIKAEREIEPIFSSETGLHSAYFKKGFGRIGISLFIDSWQLQLKGETDNYQKYWTHILEKIGKRADVGISWESQKWAFQDEPFEFSIQTQIETPRVRDRENRLLPLKQDLYRPEIWRGEFHPLEPGWHRIELEQDSTARFEFYVHPREALKDLKANADFKENLRFFSNQQVQETSANSNLEPIERLWFFAIFVFAMGFLWLEPKL